MRIANLMFGGKKGGIEQAAVDYCRALNRMGHETTAIVRPNAAVLPWLEAANIHTRTLRMPMRWNLLAAAKLRDMLTGYDMVIVHGNRAGELARLASSAPIVAVAHSRFFTPQAYFDAILCMTPEKAATLRNSTGCPTYIVPNMIDVPTEPTPRRAWSATPTIGLMGRFDPVKGIDLFIEALARVRAEFGPFKVRIGGDGALAPELQAQAKKLGVSDLIEWTGWVKDKEAFFASIDIYCLSSRSETFPLTLMEAMAQGVPSVATDCGGPSTILAEGTGILTPLSAEGIADGLLRALRDPAATQRMGAAGQEHMRQTYDTPVVAQRLHDTMVAIRDQPHPVFNVMLGRLRGGLEQAAIDYAEALAHAGINSVSVISPDAYIAPSLRALAVPAATLHNCGWWDPFAARRLRRLAKQRRARALICHGNRAFAIARHAVRGSVPIIAVAHNYRTMHFPKADACFCITTHARDQLLALGIAPERLHIMPNMARLPAQLERPERRDPPVIGTLGRLIERKGFQDWIAALALLRDRGVPFHALLGGEGEYRAHLLSLAHHHHLLQHITFTGWVEHNRRFYQQLDLFVMPSRHEPFGIVLIEAMAHGVPVVTTEVEGPRDIVTDGKDALLVPPADPVAMADAMQKVLDDVALAERLAGAARERVENEYSIDAMACRLKAALGSITCQA